MIVKPLDGCGGAGVLHVHRERPQPERPPRDVDAERRAGWSWRSATCRRRGRATSASSSSTASRSAACCACRATTSTAATSTSAARVERSPVDDRDREICRRMAPRLRERRPLVRRPRHHRRLVTEVNVTSPTGIQEIDRLDGVVPRSAGARLRRIARRPSRPLACAPRVGRRTRVYCDRAVAAR